MPPLLETIRSTVTGLVAGLVRPVGLRVGRRWPGVLDLDDPGGWLVDGRGAVVVEDAGVLGVHQGVQVRGCERRGQGFDEDSGQQATLAPPLPFSWFLIKELWSPGPA